MTVTVTSTSEFLITETNGLGEDSPQSSTPRQIDVDPMQKASSPGNESAAAHQ